MKSNTLDAQLMAPSEPVCPGDRIIFTCNQIGIFTRWTVNLSSGMIQTDARSTQVGSVLLFNDPDPFHFEIRVLSYSSNIFTTQLQVTTTRELNDVTVKCGGANEGSDYISAIQIASVGELISMLFNDDINCRHSSCSKWSQKNLQSFY